MTRKTDKKKPHAELKKTLPTRNINKMRATSPLLADLFQIVQTITAPRLTFEARLDQALKIILDHFGVEQGSIMIMEKKKLVVKAASRQKLLGCTQALDDNSVAAWVATNKKPLFVSDITADKRFRKRSDTYKKDALLSAPIMQNSRLIGVINVSDKTGHTDFFKEDITFLLDFSVLVFSLIIQGNLAEKIKHQRNTLRNRNRKLKHHEETRSDYSRMLIHDLKGPLSEVMANLDILSYTATDENKEFVEAAQVGCDRAVRMAENLATIGKLEDGKLELLKQEISPDQLIDEALSNVKGLATLKKVTLCKKVTDNLPQIDLDRVLILRVLQNLLMNALAHSQPDTSIIVGCKQLSDKNRLYFSVADEGEGIPSEDRSTIFEKYVRLKKQQDMRTGTGLGLYFCKLTIEKHRGAIGVDNRPEGGSLFYFTLPFRHLQNPSTSGETK